MLLLFIQFLLLTWLMVLPRLEQGNSMPTILVVIARAMI